MKLPNGYGSITKLTGNRRKPWMARVTCDETYDEMKHDYVRKRIVLGLIIPGLFEPPVRTLRATIPENESHIFR